MCRKNAPGIAEIRRAVRLRGGSPSAETKEAAFTRGFGKSTCWEVIRKAGWEPKHKHFLPVQSGEALELPLRRSLEQRISGIWDRVWAECEQTREGERAEAGLSRSLRTGRGLGEQPGKHRSTEKQSLPNLGQKGD